MSRPLVVRKTARRVQQTRAKLLLLEPRTAGVYVDIEKLKNAEHARAVIETVVNDWPDDLPPVRSLSLYTPARGGNS